MELLNVKQKNDVHILGYDKQITSQSGRTVIYGIVLLNEGVIEK